MYAVGFRLLGRFAVVSRVMRESQVVCTQEKCSNSKRAICTFTICDNFSSCFFFTAEIISIVMAVVLIVTLVCLIVTCVKLKRTTSEGYKTFVNS